MTTTSTAPAAVDWTAWLRRWDAQQQLHIPDREERFAAIVEALRAFAGDSPRVLDLGCGPGSLSARVLDRLPEARVVAVDADPLLLAIGRGALGSRRNLRFVDADLREDWVALLPDAGPFDAAVSTTALHWLSLEQLLNVYRRLATLIRPGGVVLDGDRLDFGHNQRAIAEAARHIEPPWDEPSGGGEDWKAWWAAAEAEPAFAAELAERARRGHDHPHNDEAHTYEFHRSALLASGFAEVGTLWQRLTNRVLVAVR